MHGLHKILLASFFIVVITAPYPFDFSKSTFISEKILSDGHAKYPMFGNCRF